MKDDRYYATVRRYTPVAGLIILALLSLGAWALWLIPAARALFSFVPNARVWAVLVFTFGIFVGAIYYIVVSLWSYNKWTANDLLHFGKVAFRAVVFVAAAAVLYFAGALTLNKIGLAPPIGQWFHDSTSSITLWVLYTAVIIVGMLAVRNASAIAAYATIVLSLLGRGALGVGSVFAMVASKAARLGGIAIAPVLKQVLYYLTPGLLLVALGVAPAVFNWYVPREVLDTVVFILVYALVVVFATVVVTRVRAQWAQIKPAAGVFPPKVAGLVGVAPFVIYFAQAICFFTAYFGIYLLLSSKVKAFQLFALSIPPKLVSTFHLNVDTIAVSNLTLIALAGSFILALVISWLASIVLQYLFEGQKAPSILVVLVVVTGLLSTYCGFTMWNGVVATADELRRGVATTKVLVAEFGDIEIRTLEVALSAATAQVDALDRELERSTRKALTARSAELELARSALRAVQFCGH
jgi:hypothetical protein